MFGLDDGATSLAALRCRGIMGVSFAFGKMKSGGVSSLVGDSVFELFFSRNYFTNTIIYFY